MMMSRFPRMVSLLAALLLSGTLILQAATTPRPLADVTIDLAQGKRVRLLDGKGKIRVIALVSTECDHCAKTVGVLSQLDAAYRAKGVEFVGARRERRLQPAAARVF